MPDIAGLKLIVPTSVTATGSGSSASVSATGKVTFNTAATVSVNGCFSSSYDNYLVVIRHVGSGILGLNIRMRVGGADNSTANSYVGQQIYADSTTVAGVRNTTTFAQGFGHSDSTARGGCHWYFYGPHLTQPTAGRSVVVSGYSSAYIQDVAFTHNQSTSYDGFTVLTSTGTISGALTIYGLAN